MLQKIKIAMTRVTASLPSRLVMIKFCVQLKVYVVALVALQNALGLARDSSINNKSLEKAQNDLWVACKAFVGSRLGSAGMV